MQQFFVVVVFNYTVSHHSKFGAEEFVLHPLITGSTKQSPVSGHIHLEMSGYTFWPINSTLLGGMGNIFLFVLRNWVPFQLERHSIGSRVPEMQILLVREKQFFLGGYGWRKREGRRKKGKPVRAESISSPL